MAEDDTPPVPKKHVLVIGAASLHLRLASALMALGASTSAEIQSPMHPPVRIRNMPEIPRTTPASFAPHGKYGHHDGSKKRRMPRPK